MNETCQKCGGKCCKYVAFPAENRIQIDHLRTRGAIIVDGLGFLNSRCPQLGNVENNGRCAIYECRPLACRTFRVGNPVCQALQRIKD